MPMELNEGDTIRVGSSTRRYRLHWVPLSQAYDMDTTFVSPLNSGLVQESETNEVRIWNASADLLIFLDCELFLELEF